MSPWNPAEVNPVYFSDPHVPYDGRAYLPQCVIEADYLINLALLRAHVMAGVTLVVFIFSATQKKITRLEGGILAALGIGYWVFSFMR